MAPLPISIRAGDKTRSAQATLLRFRPSVCLSVLRAENKRAKRRPSKKVRKFVSRFERRARRILGMIGGAKKLSSSFLSLFPRSRGRHGLQGHVDEAQETGQESRSGECTSCIRRSVRL